MRTNSYCTYKKAFSFVLGCIVALMTTTHAGHIDTTQTTTLVDEGEGEGEAASRESYNPTRWLTAGVLVVGVIAACGLAMRKLCKRRDDNYPGFLALSSGDQDAAGTRSAEPTSSQSDLSAELTKMLMPVVAGAGIGSADILSDFGIALPTLFKDKKNEWGFWIQVCILALASAAGAVSFIAEYELWRNIHINAAVKPAILVSCCVAFPFFPPCVLVTAIVAWSLSNKNLMVRCQEALIIISQGEILESLMGLAFQSDLYFRELVTALLSSMIAATLSASYTCVGVNTKKKVLLSMCLKPKLAEEDDQYFHIITGPLEELSSAPFTVLFLGIHYCFEVVSGIGCIVLAQIYLHDYCMGPPLPVPGFSHYSIAWLLFTGIQGVCILVITRSSIPASLQQCIHISVISSIVISVPLLDPDMTPMPLYGVRAVSQAVILIAASTSTFQVHGTNALHRSLSRLIYLTVAASVCMWFTLFILRRFAAPNLKLEWRETEMTKTAIALHERALKRDEWEFAHFRLSPQAGGNPQMQYLIEALKEKICVDSNATGGLGQAHPFRVNSGLDAWTLLEYLQHVRKGIDEVEVEFNTEFDEPSWIRDMMADMRTSKSTLKHYLNSLVDKDPNRANEFIENVHQVFEGKQDRLCAIISSYLANEVKHGALLAVAEAETSAADAEFKEAVSLKAAEAEFEYALKQRGSDALEKALAKHAGVSIEKADHAKEWEKRKQIESELQAAMEQDPGPSALRAALLRHEGSHIDMERHETECKIREDKAETEAAQKKAAQDKADAVEAAKEEARCKERVRKYVHGNRLVMDDYKGDDVDVVLKDIASRCPDLREIHLGNTLVTDRGLQAWSQADLLPYRLKYLEHLGQLQAMQSSPSLALQASSSQVIQSSSSLALPSSSPQVIQSSPLLALPSSSPQDTEKKLKPPEIDGLQQEMVYCGLLPTEVECANNCTALRFIDLWGCSGITDAGVMELCRVAPFLQKVIPPSLDFKAKELKARYPQISFS